MLSVATIESDLGRVEFVNDMTSRTDLPGGMIVRNVNIFSKTKNIYLSSFKLSYNYSQAVSSNYYNSSSGPSQGLYRLKLISLEEIPSDSSAHKLWQFGYNTQNLPSRFSFAQDHWGYFNGAVNNTTLLPLIPGFPPDSHPYGIRSADSASMQAEMLNSITYPTGGHSTFNYEPNGYLANEGQFGNELVNLHLYLTYNQTPFVNTQSDTFNLAKGQYITIQFKGNFSSAYLADFGSTTTLATAVLKDANGNTIQSRGVNATQNNTVIAFPSIYLPSGTYSLTISSISGQTDFSSSSTNADLTANFTYQALLSTKIVNHPVGGVRIQSIFDYDAVDTGKTIKKYFQYENPLVISPMDTTNDYQTTTVDKTYDCQGGIACGVPGCLLLAFGYYVRNSSTRYANCDFQTPVPSDALQR